jgi:lyso-ornithine lipid O-acyltransferase
MIAQGFPRFCLITFRLGAMLPAFLIGLPLQWLALKAGSSLARVLPVLFHRYLLWVMGVRVARHGRADARRPLLIVSNHISWLDIMVISSLFPVSFIAKSEVGEWPVFGTFARLQRSLFVERAKRGKTGDVTRAIAARLMDGDALVLFAEGTTGDGLRILPFRTALIGAAQASIAGEGETAFLQPLAISYPRLGGLPIGRASLPHVAWYGEMDLIPHLTDVLAMPGLDVVVHLGQVEEATPASDRKAIARRLEEDIRTNHRLAMQGRGDDNSSAPKPHNKV